MLASVQNKCGHNGIWKALGAQFDKGVGATVATSTAISRAGDGRRHALPKARMIRSTIRTRKMKMTDQTSHSPRRPQRCQPQAADEDVGCQLQEIIGQAGEDQELRQELLEGADFAAARRGQRSL